MNILVAGINHRTAPIEMREKFYLNPIEEELLLSELKNNPRVVEAFVLSTCNRTEVYAHVISSDINVLFFIESISAVKKNVRDVSAEKYFYLYSENKAVEHLFRVISGLDSLVLGEKQILGQVKGALERARFKGMFTKYFNLLSMMAIRVGKKVQFETGISSGGSSISWAAVVMAEKMLGPLEDKSVLVMGAGEMSKLAVGQINNKKFKKLYVMNRTPCHAQALARKFNAIAASFCDIKEILSEVDLCICSVGAPHYILEPDMVEKSMRNRFGKKLVLIDISMPRNIDPRVAGLKDVLLIGIDDLDKVVEKSLEKRQAAIFDVEQIIQTKMEQFYEKIQKISALPNTDYYQPLNAG